MKKIVHRSESRGSTMQGWLKSRHTFSFAGYNESSRMHFGVLRVINDDIIAPNMGFGMHPHNDMEIITIMLKGDLQHKDSMGNTSIIKEGEIQVMSAGTGVYHSEFNPNSDKETHLLQIWIFPCERGLKPRYDQMSYKDFTVDNEFYQILTPYRENNKVYINQNAYFSFGKFDEKTTTQYKVKDNKNGIYIFVIEGEIKIDDTLLFKRDGIAIENEEIVDIKVNRNSKLLVMEVPMVNYFFKD